MSGLPSFQTRRLLLRPRDMGDFDACLAMDRDPQVTRFIPGPWQNPLRHAAFLRDRMTARFGAGLGYWSIIPRAEPAGFAGWVLLLPLDGPGSEVEIGWRLPRAHWGKGYASEAARPIAEHALRVLHLPRIVAQIHPENAASMRVAEAIGMRAEGEDAEGHRRYALRDPAAWTSTRPRSRTRMRISGMAMIFRDVPMTGGPDTRPRTSLPHRHRHQHGAGPRRR